MSVVKGLGAYNARKQEAEQRKAEAEQGRVLKFALEKDGSEAVIRFAQEVDFDAKNYDEKQGIGFVNIEHKHPDKKNGWKNRANCSVESQGQCKPCDWRADETVEWDDRKGWKQQEKFYINVIGGEPEEKAQTINGKEVKRKFATNVDKKTGDGVVYLIEQGTYNGIWDQLSDVALEFGTITDTFFKIKRKGSEYNNTEYNLTRLTEVPKGAKALSEFELVDIEKDMLKEVPYEQQEAFYNRGIAGATASTTASESTGSAEAAPKAAPSDDEW